MLILHQLTSTNQLQKTCCNTRLMLHHHTIFHLPTFLNYYNLTLQHLHPHLPSTKKNNILLPNSQHNIYIYTPTFVILSHSTTKQSTFTIQTHSIPYLQITSTFKHNISQHNTFPLLFFLIMPTHSNQLKGLIYLLKLLQTYEM